MPEQKSNNIITRRSFLGLSATAGALVMLSGCARRLQQNSGNADAADGSEDADSGPVCRVYLRNPAYIEPYNVCDSAGMQVCKLLFEPLLRYDYTASSIVPAAADSWHVSADGLTYTFHLCDRAVFSNGDLVTASNFKYAWERLASDATNPDDPSRFSSFLSILVGYEDYMNGTADGINGIKANDDLELEVTLSRPYPEFPLMLCHPAYSPVPSTASDLSTFARCPVGNGPFKMDGEWVDAQHIYLERHSEFHGDAPQVERLEMMILQNDQTAFLEYQAGNLDVCTIPLSSYTAESSSLTASDDGYTLTQMNRLADGALNAVGYLVFNLDNDVVASVDLRRAISLAIDRADICSKVFDGTATPADGIVPPGVDGYVQGAWSTSVLDTTGAQSALVAAGYAAGSVQPTITLSYGSDEVSKAVISAIADDLKAIGLTVLLDEKPWSDFESMLYEARFQVALTSWIADMPSKDVVLAPLFNSTSSFDYGGYSNPSFESGMAAARENADETARQDAYRALENQLSNDVPVAPLFFYDYHETCGDAIAQLYCDPSGFIDYSHAQMA